MISVEDFLANHSVSETISQDEPSLADVVDVADESSGDQYPDNFADEPIDGNGEAYKTVDVQDTMPPIDSISGAYSDDYSHMRSDEENKCQESALRLLDASQKSSGTLIDRLRSKGFEDEVIDRVIERLIRVGLINDEDYARRVVSSCARRGIGEFGAFHELKRKGVDSALARRVLQEAQEEGLFIEAAYTLVEQTLKRARGADKQVVLRRLWSAAGRKGHSADLIRQAYDELTMD